MAITGHMPIKGWPKRDTLEKKENLKKDYEIGSKRRFSHDSRGPEKDHDKRRRRGTLGKGERLKKHGEKLRGGVSNPTGGPIPETKTEKNQERKRERTYETRRGVGRKYCGAKRLVSYRGEDDTVICIRAD